MSRTLVRIALMSVFLLVVGGLGPVDVLQAKPNNERPPQVLPSGFESSDSLLRDVERAERAPLYSAWIVESSRFVNVPFGASSRTRPVSIPPSTCRSTWGSSRGRMAS